MPKQPEGVAAAPRVSRWAHGLACLALLAAIGCATTRTRTVDFEDAHKRYTRLIRWSDFDKAKEFVAPEEQEAFREKTRALGNVRFMDYDILSVDLDPDAKEATVVVSYSAYRRSAPAAVAIEEQQEWRRDEEEHAWRVRSSFKEKTFEPERRF
jgi:hypothetical protein